MSAESDLTHPAAGPPESREDLRDRILFRISRARTLRTLVGRPFMRVNEWAWSHLPPRLAATPLVRCYGDWLHSWVRLRAVRTQYHGTFFLRNRPELELIRRLCARRAQGSTLSLSVLACSNGAEVYSILWAIRRARPDLKIVAHAVDISPEILEIAREGRYSVHRAELMDSRIFERVTRDEIRAIFDQDGECLTIKAWIKDGIQWHAADVADPAIVSALGPQDIVVANRFLCHMNPPEAEPCLRNIASLVRPGGYLFVSGIDLDVRTGVARQSGWEPVSELLEEMHEGDSSLRQGWPWQYWGLEPLNRRKRDWTLRYASAFRVGRRVGETHGSEGAPSPGHFRDGRQANSSVAATPA